MTHINVTLMHPPGETHAEALADAAKYVSLSLCELGFDASQTRNLIAKDAVNIVFCSHCLSDDEIRAIPLDAIIFNSERLSLGTDWPAKKLAYRILLHRNWVWDYSVNNLATIPHEHKAIIEFGYSESMLSDAVIDHSHKALLFYGLITPWRGHLLEQITRRGITVETLFGVYGEERDSAMLSAWAVLNLHKDCDDRTFEPIRCFYPLINRVPVISESILDASATLFMDSVFFFHASELADMIYDLYLDDVRFGCQSNLMLDRFRMTSGHESLHRAIARYVSWIALKEGA